MPVKTELQRLAYTEEAGGAKGDAIIKRPANTMTSTSHFFFKSPERRISDTALL